MEIATPNNTIFWLLISVLFGLLTIAALKSGTVDIYGTGKSFSRKDHPVPFWALTALTTLACAISCAIFMLIFTFG